MANTLTTNPITLDTIGATSQTTRKLLVLAFRVVRNVASATCTLKNTAGATVFTGDSGSVANTDGVAFARPLPVNGLDLTAISANTTLSIYLA